MTAARALVVWGGLFFVFAMLVGLLLEWNRPLPPKAVVLRGLAATIGLGVFLVGLIGVCAGY